MQNPALRYASIDALAERPSPGVAGHVLEQAFTDSSSEVRKRAMEKLIDVDKQGTRGLRLLLAGLRDEDSTGYARTPPRSSTCESAGPAAWLINAPCRR